MTSPTSDLLITRTGVLGRIRLNRPKVINALSHAMALELHSALRDWQDDPSVSAVLISGEGDRGLCAGGDIRAIYDDARSGSSATVDFWRDEYKLNAAIASYPKPIVAFQHGLVMGGGIGISAHASQRIVTDGSILGMPEVSIGLVPDVGGSWLLSRAPGELGTHVGLTGAQFGPGDAIELGLSDWYVPADRLEALPGALGDISAAESDAAGAVGALIQEVTEPAPWSELAARRHWIDSCYQAETAEEILVRLENSGEPDASAAAKEIIRKSPSSVKVTLSALRRARALESLEAGLDQELRVSTRCFEAPDLAEGIRAQVIDKDRNPRWQPATLEQVTDERVQGYFASLGERELGLALATEVRA